ncbi:NUDIX domain-containing protein [Thermaerobacter sp. PB12/4term]|uniref:NUDIX hydrolase n=1 Tax=Thermaerobacter sp. PB12/4term TaxID=2293838 RepID=UPI000E32C2F2|nr:NUDIX domain-containing protein [Thermaerobacter sp. PB12/4term]QIA27554.1 NUDIX domain-containing protein [Thermaerobacter sp. PB12/4term]
MEHAAGWETIVAEVTEDAIAIEVRWGREVFYVEVSGGDVRYRETTRWDRNASYIENLFDLGKLVQHLRTAHASLRGRSVLAELRFDNHQMAVVRWRQRPAASRIPWTVEQRWSQRAADYEKCSETRFVWGAFDCEGVVWNSDEWNPEEPAGDGRKGPLVLLTGQHPVWADGRLASLLRQGRQVVLLDSEDGFRLAERRDRLPPPGVPKHHFGYMSVAWLPPQTLLGRVVRVISDGHQGVLLLPRAEAGDGRAPHATHDRRRTDLLPAARRRVTLTPVARDVVPSFEQVTSVGVVAFTAEGKVVVTLQSRGFDIPGGHVQLGDRTLEETARREALEEARVTLGKVEYLGALRSNYYTVPTYIVLMAAMVDQVLPFEPTPCHRLRLFLTPEQFGSVYSAGDRERMQKAVNQARALLFP